METYDFAIIGAGGAGLAAGMYAARLKLKVAIFGNSQGTELPIGGLITSTNFVENYPGILETSGLELAKKLEQHARKYPLVTIKTEKIISIKKKGKTFFIESNKNEYCTKALLIATGNKIKKLEIPGSREYENKGVSYCALCDAPLYKDKVVCVIGGSDSASVEALILSEYAKKVYMIYRGEKIHPEPVTLEKIKINKKIEIINNTNVLEIKGKGFVEEVILNKPYNKKKSLKVDGVYVSIGHIPSSELAKQLGVKTNRKDEIIINHRTSETNLPGVFAAGDVADKPFKQLITGVAEGCVAAYSAYKYIGEMKIKCDK